jgi:hypothetical protein
MERGRQDDAALMHARNGAGVRALLSRLLLGAPAALATSEARATRIDTEAPNESAGSDDQGKGAGVPALTSCPETENRGASFRTREVLGETS